MNADHLKKAKKQKDKSSNHIVDGFQDWVLVNAFRLFCSPCGLLQPKLTQT